MVKNLKIKLEESNDEQLDEGYTNPDPDENDLNDSQNDNYDKGYSNPDKDTED